MQRTLFKQAIAPYSKSVNSGFDKAIDVFASVVNYFNSKANCTRIGTVSVNDLFIAEQFQDFVYPVKLSHNNDIASKDILNRDSHDYDESLFTDSLAEDFLHAQSTILSCLRSGMKTQGVPLNHKGYIVVNPTHYDNIIVVDGDRTLAHGDGSTLPLCMNSCMLDMFQEYYWNINSTYIEMNYYQKWLQSYIID